MVRSPSCDKSGLKKGAWTQEEDNKLIAYVTRYGTWNWRLLPRFAGLARCGKSCRLRWLNYLRPNIKRGNYTEEEENIIIKLHEKLGNKWSSIATHLPGRTDNEIKNHWHTTLKKRFIKEAVANNETVKATKPCDSGAKSKVESDSPITNLTSGGPLSPLSSSSQFSSIATASEVLSREDGFNFEDVDDNYAPIEIVSDIVEGNFEGSDTTVTGIPHAWEWELSTPSSSTENLVPENDHFALLEATQPTITNFWTHPYVPDMSHVPNELLVPLASGFDQYLSPMYDVDLWNQNNSQDLHVSLFQ